MTVTQSETAPLVVVSGSTGNQGGSVIRFLIDSKQPYRIRALTRDNTKPKAKALEKEGVETYSVVLDADHHKDVVKAFEGADVVFSMTNFWEHADKDREIAEGKSMIDAGIEAGVKLFIYSALPSPSRFSGGKYKKIHHFEGKSIIADYGESKRSSSFIFRTVEAGLYNSNLLGQQLIRKGPDGWTLKNNVALADFEKIPAPTIDIDEYGLWVVAVIENKEVQDDKRPVLTSSEDVYFPDILKQLESAAGIKITHTQLSEEDNRAMLSQALPPHIVEDMSENWPYFAEFGYYGGQDVHWVDKYLSRPTTKFADWLKKTDLSEFQKA